jgi:HK97 family phage major capsid protein
MSNVPLTEETAVAVFTKVLSETTKGLKDELKKEITEETAKANEATLKAIADQKAAEDAKANAVVNSKAVKNGKDYSRAIKFLNCVISGDNAGLKDLGLKILNSDTDSSGGFVVPEEFSSMVDEIRLNVGLARKLARYVPMRAARKNMPILDSDVLVYWPGQGGTKTSSEFTFGNVVLDAETVAGMIVLTNELIADSDVNMVEFIAQRFGQALAKEEDRQMLVGTGAPFIGVMNASGTNLVQMSSGNTTFSQVTIADLNSMRAQLEETVLDGAVWVMHRFVLAIVQSIKENNQSIVSFCNPVITADYKGGMVSPSAMLLGHPVYTSSLMPSTTAVATKFMIFGNFKYYYMGEREGQKVDRSDSATVAGRSLFETNCIALRIEERIAMAIGLPTAFAILRTAAS